MKRTPRRSRSCWRTLGLSLFAIAAIAVSAPAGAALRIYDAPRAALRAGNPEASVPPIPPEYLTEDRGWIEFAYHPSTRERVRPVINRASAVRDELSALLGREVFATPVKVRIAAVAAELPNLAPVDLGEGTTAASFGAARLAVMSATPRLALDPTGLDGVFRHQLAHLALDEATGGVELPRWLHDGFAAHASGEHAALRAQTLCVAALKAQLVPLAELESALPREGDPTSIAYAQAADFVRFLVDDARKPSFAAAVERLRTGVKLEDAIAGAYGSGGAALELAWRDSAARRYGFVPVLLASALALAVAMAAGLAVQRIRARKPSAPAPRRRLRADHELRPRAGRPVTAQLVAARSARPRGDVEADAEVPKVEHNGQWHTLH